MIVRCKR